MRKFARILMFPMIGIMCLSGCASRRQMTKMETQLDYLEQSNTNIERKLSQLDSLYRAQEESQRLFLAALKASITSFEDKLEQLDYKLVDLNDRIDKIASRPGLVPVPVGQDSSQSADTAGTQVAQADGNVIYGAAYKELVAGNTQIAKLGFEEYIKSFPGTELTDDAQYWLGECYYNLDPPDYQKAKLEFQKLIDKYPKSDRLSSGKFKLARSLEELNLKPEAIKIYREVLKEFPNTAEANRSKVQLEGLGESPE